MNKVSPSSARFQNFSSSICARRRIVDRVGRALRQLQIRRNQRTLNAGNAESHDQCTIERGALFLAAERPHLELTSAVGRCGGLDGTGGARLCIPVLNEVLDQFLTLPMNGEAINAASMASKEARINRALGAVAHL